MTPSNRNTPDEYEYHSSNIGTGCVTRRTSKWKIPSHASGFPSSLLPDCDYDKYAKNIKAPVRNCRALRWVITCATMLLLSAQLYTHKVSVEPCVRAQMSLNIIESSVGSNSIAPAGASPNTIPSIPKIIHQQWPTTNIENDDLLYRYDKWGDWHAAWQRLFPESEGYRHMLWTDDEMLDLITEHYPWFLPVYNRYPTNIERVDASRYFILYHYGGIYADMDYEPLTNFWKWLPTDRVSLIESPYQIYEKAQNSLMASPQGHPFWNATFKVLAEKKENWNWEVLGSTGPRMLSSVMEQTPSNYWYLLPCENFQRIPSATHSASPWEAIMIQQATTWIPKKSCGHWQKQGPGDCQFGRHHNTVTWIKKKGAFRFWLERILFLCNIWSAPVD